MKVFEALKIIRKRGFKYEDITVGFNNTPPVSVLLVTGFLDSFYLTYNSRTKEFECPIMFLDYEVERINIGTDIVILCYENEG